jgi:hypothetical protein
MFQQYAVFYRQLAQRKHISSRMPKEKLWLLMNFVIISSSMPVVKIKYLLAIDVPLEYLCRQWACC